MNCINTKINVFERKAAFPKKPELRSKDNGADKKLFEEVVIVKKIKQEGEYKHWLLQTRNAKIV